MDIEQARTFLAIAAHGSFVAAAERLHVTQSTVSARIRQLEADLGARLFVRNRAGASLTQSGRRFLRHAKTLVLTVEQAHHDLGLSGRYQATIRIGARIALWDGFLPRWVGWLRRTEPDVAVQSEIGFEEDLMRRMQQGTLDVALMYTPTHAPELVVEHLFDETLVMVSTSPDTRWPGDDYIFVDWGPGFYAWQQENWPDLGRPPRTVNIGWLAVQLMLEPGGAGGGACFLPRRMAEPLVAAGRLFRVADAPERAHPAYMLFPRRIDDDILPRALEGLRQLVRSPGAGNAADGA
ncbi:MAG: LysR family transcriptional regulator [Thiohalocapsa sp.]|jgi:DNA-binding transcriptional LysR family regulator|uniref:LysR family transcriptional regulator n=1 Tax=Thiohalocapsa sp. TaxID=2497641 RepID=UPI0025E68753|nr:LysR family transcriptional regulator [Thiohalocapsa sp.]MCG6942132.1 LysR family transcriptional regulator [Thiohalocapsa sp.]